MTIAFEKRRTRLRAMKELFGHYLPSDQLISCPRCGQEHPRSEVEANLSVCPMCGYHWPLSGVQRLAMVMDEGRWRELNADLPAADPLAFPGYGEKLRQVQERTGLQEAEVTAVGSIHDRRCVVCVLDSRFLMGRMSAAVGEKITLAVGYALRRHLPLIIFSASGGAEHYRQRHRPRLHRHRYDRRPARGGQGPDAGGDSRGAAGTGGGGRCCCCCVPGGGGRGLHHRPGAGGGRRHGHVKRARRGQQPWG